MPEELVKPEELSKYRQVASHVVSGWVPLTLDLGPSVLFLAGQASPESTGREPSGASGPISSLGC